MSEIHQKYDNEEGVTIASSLPSIEYWLLLHFDNTNRYFGTSGKVVDVLKKHIPEFEKREHFLKQEKWISSLLQESRMVLAYKRAKQFGHNGSSFSDMWKGIDKFEETKATK